MKSMYVGDISRYRRLSGFSPYFKIFVYSSPLLLFLWKNISPLARMSDGGENAHNEKRMAGAAVSE